MTDVFVTQAYRTPFGRFVQDYAEYRLIDLVAHIIHHAKWEFDLAVLGCTLTACAGQMPLNHALLRSHKDPNLSGGVVSYGQSTGLFALEQAYNAIQANNAQNVLAIGAESLTHAPHLIAGLRQGVTKGMCLVSDHIITDLLIEHDSQRRLSEVIESFCRFQNMARDHLDQYALEAYEHTLKSLPMLKKCIVQLDPLDYDVIFDDLRPMLIEGAKPFFGAEGILTDAHIATWADGACGVMLSSEPDQVKLMAVMRHYDGQLTQVLPGLLCQLCQQLGWKEQDIDILEISDFKAAFPVQIAQIYDYDFNRINPMGGSLTLGWPMGASSLMHVVHLYHQLMNTDAKRGIVLTYAGGKHALGCALEKCQ